MLILVTGGAASGKSEHAERLVCEKAQSRLYLATMQPFGKSAEARIARHRALRAGKGFATVERTLDLANLRLSRQYDGILAICWQTSCLRRKAQVQNRRSTALLQAWIICKNTVKRWLSFPTKSLQTACRIRRRPCSIFGFWENCTRN